jgi:hypothetical protein
MLTESTVTSGTAATVLVEVAVEELVVVTTVELEVLESVDVVVEVVVVGVAEVVAVVGVVEVELAEVDDEEATLVEELVGDEVVELEEVLELVTSWVVFGVTSPFTKVVALLLVWRVISDEVDVLEAWVDFDGPTAGSAARAITSRNTPTIVADASNVSGFFVIQRESSDLISDT